MDRLEKDRKLLKEAKPQANGYYSKEVLEAHLRVQAHEARWNKVRLALKSAMMAMEDIAKVLEQYSRED